MNRIPSVFIAILALAVALMAPARAQFGPPTVVVAKTISTELAPRVNVPGTVVSRDDARIAAEVEGPLLWVADVGTRVARGDRLAKIEDTILRIQQDEFDGLVAREQARLKFLVPELERLQKLAADNNAAKSRLDQIDSDLDVARSDLQVARARLNRVEDQLNRTTIRAPFDGVVTERLTNAGERVSVGDQVVRLVNPAAVEVVARAPLNSVAFIVEGDELPLRNDRKNGIGTVRTIVPFGNLESHMFEVRLDVEHSEWTVGESVRLSVPTAAPREVLAVPRDALVLRRDGTTVFRINAVTGDDGNAQNIAERILVSPGLGDGNLIEVTGDLHAGDMVVVRGAERLRPDMPVMIQNAPAGNDSSPGLAGN